MSMLNAVIISGMSIVSFIIKHIHFSDRNVMLRSVSDRIDGGSPGVSVWEIGQVLPGLCFFFPRKPICRTDVGGDGSGGCFSAAASQLHHSITLYMQALSYNLRINIDIDHC